MAKLLILQYFMHFAYARAADALTQPCTCYAIDDLSLFFRLSFDGIRFPVRNYSLQRINHERSSPSPSYGSPICLGPPLCMFNILAVKVEIEHYDYYTICSVWEN